MDKLSKYYEETILLVRPFNNNGKEWYRKANINYLFNEYKGSVDPENICTFSSLRPYSHLYPYDEPFISDEGVMQMVKLA